jgi:hypothetical protein
MSWREITTSNDPQFRDALAVLERSIESGTGEMAPSDVAWLVDQRKSRLFVVDHGRVVAAVLVQMQTLPARSILFVQHLAADNFDDLAAEWHHLEDLARHGGASSIAGACTEAAARIFCEKLPAKVRKVYVEQPL